MRTCFDGDQDDRLESEIMVDPSGSDRDETDVIPETGSQRFPSVCQTHHRVSSRGEEEVVLRKRKGVSVVQLVVMDLRLTANTRVCQLYFFEHLICQYTS